MFGTPAYMAPEQALGKPIDGRADLYAVATILFEMLTGRVPFDHPDPMMQMRMQVKAPPPRLDMLAKNQPWCTPQLVTLVDGGLTKDPAAASPRRTRWSPRSTSRSSRSTTWPSHDHEDLRQRSRTHRTRV